MTQKAVTIKPMQHQTDAINLCRTHRGFGFFWDCGLGKTIAMILNHQMRPLPTVVVSPKAIMYAAWEADCRKMQQPCTVMHGTPKQRTKMLDSLMDTFNLTDNDVVYEMTDDLGGIPFLITNFETFKKREVVKALLQMGIKRMIVDESSKIKNPESQITKATIVFADHMDEVYLLTGTPAPNGPEEYWSQLRCLDKSPGGLADDPRSKATPSFYRWCNYWLNPTYNYFGQRRVIDHYDIKPGVEDDFKKMLASCSQTLKADDVFELPPISTSAIRIPLSKKERKHYDEISQALATSFDGEKFSTTANALLTKLRQIVGGHLYDQGDVRQVGTTKLDALVELVESIGSKPVIIWAEFTAEINAIKDRMEKVGRKVWVMNGHSKNNGQRCAQFQEGADIDTLVCHPQSVGHGVTLTRAKHSIWYSHNFSYEAHHQARCRNYRKGQDEKVFRYYIIAEDTVDSEMLQSLRGKKQSSDGILNALRAIAASQAVTV